MADFTTLAHDWLVRVNDGFHVAEYRIENASSEAEAFSRAATLWATGEGKQPHGGDPGNPKVPMPSIDQARAATGGLNAPLTAEETARLAVLSGQETRTPAEQAEMDALDARRPLTDVERERLGVLRDQVTRTPAEQTEMDALSAREKVAPVGSPLTDDEKKRRDVLLAMTPRTAMQQAELDALLARDSQPAPVAPVV
jgi:hypothetical protein